MPPNPQNKIVCPDCLESVKLKNFDAHQERHHFLQRQQERRVIQRMLDDQARRLNQLKRQPLSPIKTNRPRGSGAQTGSMSGSMTAAVRRK